MSFTLIRTGCSEDMIGLNSQLLWEKSKSAHFEIFYMTEHHEFANDVIRRSEEYYRSIANRIGYARYDDFWTWDNRVQIYIYPDQKTFMDKTGMPSWSRAGSLSHENLFKNRLIVTYAQEDHFLENALPHEISHLMLKDFIRDQPLPSWFEEGFSQLNEPEKQQKAQLLMKRLVKENRYIFLEQLRDFSVYDEKDDLIVSVFYIQSYSLLDFLIHAYGSDRFSQWCRNIRDGLKFEEAFNKAYKSIFSFQDLEKKWLSYMKDN